MNVGPQTAENWIAFLFTLNILFGPQSIAHALSGINVAPQGESK